MTNSKIYLANQFKQIDANCGIDADTLMQNAAKALCRCLKATDSANAASGRNVAGATDAANSADAVDSANAAEKKICVVCGKGNNGGDGYALACLLKQGGAEVTVVAADAPASPLAAKYAAAYTASGGCVTDSLAAIKRADTVVDCVFGFSFHGRLSGRYAETVEAINSSGAFVLSADLPSGLEADSDALPALCVRADRTCTFTAYKPALVSYPAKATCGAVTLEDIGVPEAALTSQKPFASVADASLLKLLPARPANAHKGSFGTLAALCGSRDMCGAAALSCLAALKSGVGLVKLYTDEHCAAAVRSKLWEPIVSEDPASLDPARARETALLIGCGCGRARDDDIRRLLTTAKIPTVLDADGINCIAGDIELYRSVTCPLVVTPHPAEMGRLTGKSAGEVNSARLAAASDFAKEYGFVTVLKGAATVTASPDGRLCLNTTGNNGLSKGGSGDVLAGLVASLMAQGLPGYEAACLGVYLHGAAADRLAAEKGVYALLPSELPDAIGRIMQFG